MATVLSLEDDRLSQRLIEKVFRNAGHDVLIADSVQAGLGMLRERVLIDMVVLDSHLGTDLGWTFLEAVRQSPVFQRLPVIVYTGYTERQEVLRYAALKVQSVHVKPIKAEVLLGELDRATRNDLRSQLLQPAEQVCARLRIDTAEYARLLLAGITHLDEDRATISKRLGSLDDPELRAALDRLKQRPKEIGIRWIDELADLLADQLRRKNEAGVAETLGAIEAVVSNLRQRAVSMLGSDKSLLQSSAVPLGPSAAPISAELPPVSPPADGFGAFARKMLGRPFWMYGEHLLGLQIVPPAPEKLVEAATVAGPSAEAVTLWLEAIELIESIPRLDIPDTAQALGAVPGFTPACRRIVQRVTMGEEVDIEEIDLTMAATRLGVLPGVVLAAAARLVRAPVPSPLELQPLRHRAAVMALVSLELGRILKLQDPHRVAAASLGWNLGLWALAVSQPALAALALSRVTPEKPLPEAMQEVAAITPQELAHRILTIRGASEFIRESGRAAFEPAQAQTRESQVALGIVAIAEHLAAAATAEDSRGIKVLREQLLQPDYTAWTFLATCGIDLPIDRGEIVEVALTVASTAAWIAREATA